MGSFGQEYWLISLKNGSHNDSGEFNDMAQNNTIRNLENTVGDKATVKLFQVPELRVGTLEKLMLAGDTLQTVDHNVESSLRRLEKMYIDLTKSNSQFMPLGINNHPPAVYLENFRWNEAKYSPQRSIEELIRNIQLSATKMDSEMRSLSAALQEKRLKQTTLEKVADSSMMNANLDDILTPKINPSMIHDSEYLKTIVVIVRRSDKKSLEQKYESLGSNLVGYGTGDDRDSVKGSPVVPGSLVDLEETCGVTDKDYCMFLITILKKFEKDFGVAVQEVNAVVRDYDFQTSYETVQRIKLESDGTTALDLARAEAQETLDNVIAWCSSHYGDAFSSWIHIKAIRVFVESVLRYGLPVNFSAAVVKVIKSGNESQVRELLAKQYECLDSSGLTANVSMSEAAELGEELFPYVSFSLVPEQNHA